MEAYEKPWVRSKTFLDSEHGQLGCTACHGGDNESEWKTVAHEEMIPNPSAQPEENCAECHEEATEHYQSSLHASFRGLETALLERTGHDDLGVLAEPVQNHCASCHVTCGECHVSLPAYQGGGLASGHKFAKQPPMVESCTACHGTRVGHEYLGKNEGLAADVHWESERMLCTDCHGEELHGTGEEYPDRYSKTESPQCKDCHEDIFASGLGNDQHTIHLEDLSCQTCHSQEYKNCFSCHVGIDEKGIEYAKSDPSQMLFKIGKNTNPATAHAYAFAPVRHVPIARDTFAYYGDNLLPNFDTRSTWRTTTPHNIQKNTPQNESCNACHGNSDLFLTIDDLQPDELEANRDVITDAPPPR